jgi:hypothetical protein
MSSKEFSASAETPTGASIGEGKRWFKDELLPMVGSGKEMLPGHGLHVRETERRNVMLNSPVPVERYPVLSIRLDAANPDHHLWNNNGTWYLCYTVLTSAITASRIRTSLKTHSLETARALRDQALSAIPSAESLKREAA